MRVLFAGFSYVIGLYQTKLVEISKLPGVEVGLLCPENWKFKEWSKVYKLSLLNKEYIRYFPASFVFFNGIQGAHMYLPFTISSVMWRFKPDILYIEQEVFSLSAFQLTFFAKMHNVPSVIFCWENMEKHLSVFRMFSTQFVLKNSAHITPGNNDAKKLLQTWGYIGPTTIIPQIGVDRLVFSPSTPRNEKDSFCVGFVGRLVEEKGIDLILFAVKNLLDSGLDVKILICGSGPYKPNLEKLAIEFGIQNAITWLGEFRYDEVPLAIEKMDVLVLPSRTKAGWKEQFGHVLIEAMSMKVPVIGSSSGAIPDVIGTKDYIFPENDASELARIIKKMITNPCFYSDAVTYCDARAQEFTHKKIAHKLVDIFSSVLNAH